METESLTALELLAQQQAIDMPSQVALSPEELLEQDNAQMDLLEEAIVLFGQVEIPTTHKFQTGMYIREVTIPEGCLLTSELHATPHVVIMSKGVMAVWTAGKGQTVVSAPFAFVSEPNTRRVGFAHEETVWSTIHATYETDVAEIEKSIFIRKGATPVERVEAKRLAGEIV